MPHNMYLHSALVQSRSIDRSQAGKVREANFYFSIEAGVALFVSFLINLVVVCVFAAAFFDPVCALTGTARWHDRPDCAEVGLADAGEALKGALGGAAQTVWAIGLLAAGQSSTMTGTYAGQFVFDGCWQMRIAPWKRVAVTRSIALVPAVAVAVLSSANAGLADTLDQYLNILQSVQLPFAVLPLLRFTSSTAIMGDFASNRWLCASGWALSLLFIVANFYLIGTFISAPQSPIPHQTWFYVVVTVVAVLYVAFILYLVWEDLQQLWDFMRGRRQRARKWEAQHRADAHDESINGHSDALHEGEAANGELEAAAEDEKDPDAYG